MMKISSKLLNLIKKSDSFIISGHINPEGDSLGSCLALALGLKKLGKSVSVLSRDPVPETLQFLPSSRLVKHSPPKKKVDLLIIVDCNELSRTGLKDFNATNIAIIDHHILPSSAPDLEFHKNIAASHIDPDSAAAGVLVYKVLNGLKVPMDKNIATNLYTAILTDTGGFRYGNSSAESLLIASHLVEAGASPWSISKELYENTPFKSMKLLGHSLSTLERKDGIAWININRNMFQKTGTTAEDCEDFVDFPRKVRGIEVAIFFRQDSKITFKLSLRSKGKVNVQKIAKSFGGGGHAAAAGCSVKGTFKEVQTKVFRAVRKAIKEM
jgi:phosphoesterase RecJ-like protein